MIIMMIMMIIMVIISDDVAARLAARCVKGEVSSSNLVRGADQRYIVSL